MTLLGDVETLPGHRLALPVLCAPPEPAERSWPLAPRARLTWDARGPVRVPRPGLLAALGEMSLDWEPVDAARFRADLDAVVDPWLDDE